MSLKISLAWMGAAQGASFAFQFAASIVLARYLTPHEMGIFAIAIAAVGLLSLIQSFGLQPFIVREEELDQQTERTAFTINALISVCLALATFFTGYIGAAIWDDDGVRRVLTALAISPVLGIAAFLPGAQLERGGRFKQLAAITMLTSLVGAISTIIFVVLGFSYMSLAYSYIISSAFLSTGLIWVGRPYFSCRLGLTSWRRVLGFSASMLAISTATTFSARMSELSLGRILGLHSLGLYNRASNFNSIIWSNIHSLLSRVILVDFAKLQRSGVPLRERYLNTVAMVTGLLWPAFGGLALTAKPLILLLFGRPWEEAALPLTYLALSSMVLVATTMSLELCTATGNIRVAARVEAIRASCSLPLFLAGCLVSLSAAALSRVIDAALAYILYRKHLARMSGATFSDLSAVYRQGAILTFAALLPTASLMLVQGTFDPSMFLLVPAVVLGIMLWTFMLFKVGHPLAHELMLALKPRFPRLMGYLAKD